MILSKEISTGKITYVDNPLMSKFIPNGMKDIIETIPKHHLILGVAYSEGDHQIGISGKRKFGERIEDTVNREMIEEVNLSCNLFIKCMKKIGNNYFFKLNINKTNLYPCYLQKIDDREDTKERMIVVIHGTKNKILNYINVVKLNTNNTDYITSVWCDTAENILTDHF